MKPEVEPTLEELLSALSRTHVVWLEAQPDTVAALLPLLQARLAASDGTLFQADPPSTEGAAFGPLRGLLCQLLAWIEGDTASLLTICAPELGAVLPELASSRLFSGSAPLESLVQLPLGTARTLSHESEYAFRIITQIGWFITRVSQSDARLQDHPPVFVFPALDQVDRPTLLTIYHLCLRAVVGNFRLLLVSASLPSAGDPAERVGLFDVDYERQVLLARLYRQIAPVIVCASAIAPPSWLNQSLPAEDAGNLAAQRPALEAFQAHSPSAAQTAIQRALILSMRDLNPEFALYLAKTAINHPAGDCSIVVLGWQTAGAAHVMLGNYPQALDCFQSGYDNANTPVLQARMAMFRALVCAKYMKDFPRASHFIAQGLTALDGLDTPDALLERGWLSNLEALIAYRSQAPAQALHLTQAALRFMQPYHNEEANGLKTNLITNLSIVLEATGEYNRALRVWRLFRGLLNSYGEHFAKHYYYREGILNLKASRDADAIMSFERAFAAATIVGDLVCMEAAAHAEVSLAYHDSAYSAAVEWAEHIPLLLERLGDQEQLWRSWVMIAGCYAAMSDLKGAMSALKQGIFLLEQLGRRSEHGRVSILLAQLEGGLLDIGDWSPWIPPMPTRFFRWPSELVIP